MQVLLLKDKRIDEKLSIEKGQVFKVRPMKQTNIFGGEQHYYQIIDIKCPFSGELLPAHHCVEQPNEIFYTEQEMKAIEKVHLSKLDILRNQNERAQKLVRELTETINKKNAEFQKLDFCVNVLASSLISCCEVIHKLKEKS